MEQMNVREREIRRTEENSVESIPARLRARRLLCMGGDAKRQRRCGGGRLPRAARRLHSGGGSVKRQRRPAGACLPRGARRLLHCCPGRPSPAVGRILWRSWGFPGYSEIGCLGSGASWGSADATQDTANPAVRAKVHPVTSRRAPGIQQNERIPESCMPNIKYCFAGYSRTHMHVSYH